MCPGDTAEHRSLALAADLSELSVTFHIRKPSRRLAARSRVLEIHNAISSIVGIWSFSWFPKFSGSPQINWEVGVAQNSFKALQNGTARGSLPSFLFDKKCVILIRRRDIQTCKAKQRRFVVIELLACGLWLKTSWPLLYVEIITEIMTKQSLNPNYASLFSNSAGIPFGKVQYVPK